MSRALGVFAIGLVLAVLAAPTARAGGHYGSFGFQMGLYHYPPPGGYAPAAGGHHHRAYTAPAGYGYAPMMMMAPAAGCSGAGYAPMMMAPAGGCSGSGYAPAYGYAAPGYGYAAPSYGYAAPQQGLLTFAGGAGGIVETIRALKEIRDTFDDLRGGGKQDTATKESLDRLQADVNALRAEFNAKGIATVPADLGGQLKEINRKLDALKADNEGIKKTLKSKFGDLVFP